MYLERFLANPSKRADLKKVLALLEEIGIFNILYEMSYRRAGEIPSTGEVLEIAAIQRGISRGYFQAIEDLFWLSEAVTPLDVKKVTPDYGAGSVLKEMGLTEKEIEDARSRAHSSRS